MVKRKTKDQKSSSVRVLKKKLWKIFSEYIRLRDGNADGYGNCCSCGKLVYWKDADAGHYFGRGISGSSGIYFCRDNVHLQCKRCNAFLQGNKEGYTKFMQRRYGERRLGELERIHYQTVKRSPDDYEAMIKFYKQKVNGLRQTKKTD